MQLVPFVAYPSAHTGRGPAESRLTFSGDAPAACASSHGSCCVRWAQTETNLTHVAQQTQGLPQVLGHPCCCLITLITRLAFEILDCTRLTTLSRQANQREKQSERVQVAYRTERLHANCETRDQLTARRSAGTVNEAGLTGDGRQI